MPETLLKKRKSQEKERAEKAEQREEKKKVRHTTDLAYPLTSMMKFTQTSTSSGYAVIVNHLSGLKVVSRAHAIVITFVRQSLTCFIGEQDQA